MSFRIDALPQTSAGASIFLFILFTVAVSLEPRPLPQRLPPPQLQTVVLNKQHVPVLRRGKVVGHKTAYFGTVFAGLPNPQPFSVLFDTGSGHVVLPSEHCVSETCMKHRRFQRGLSATAKDIDGPDGDAANETKTPQHVELQYGTGEVSGELLEEVLCLGIEPGRTEASDGCARLGVVLASSLTTDPFEHFSFDGVVGLGLESLALQTAFSFFGRMSKSGNLPEPCFSVYLSKSDDPDRSEIAFGGHRKEHAVSDFDWVPVAVPELGYWQVALRGVRVGDTALGLCANGGCRAVLDTGTSMLGVPEQALSNLHHLLARMAEPASDCRDVAGPPIIFDLGDFELRLNAEDYSRPAPMAVRSKSGNASFVCRSSLLPVPADVDDEGEVKAELFVFGEPFLQRHYTKYDWQQLRIGFALARQEEALPPQAVTV